MKPQKKIMLLIKSSYEFGRKMLLGIADYARNKPEWDLITDHSLDIYRGAPIRSVSQLDLLEPDGIIMVDIPENQKFLDENLPKVIVEANREPAPGVPYVVTDDRKIAMMAAEYFISKGFRNFAFCGIKHIPWSQAREIAFCEIIHQAGSTCATFEISTASTKSKVEKELNEMAEWLKALDKPLAVLACNDERAHDVIVACEAANLNIPSQVAVLGVDNDALLCTLCRPALSSIALSAQASGYESAKVLDALMQGKPYTGQTILTSPMKVETRKSTDALAVTDKDVVQALQYIRRNLQRSLAVEDVAEAVMVSERTLQRKFRKYLNNSVNEVIRISKIDRIARMLLETDLTVSQITLAMGFMDYKNISQFFKKQKGMTPSQYRKRYKIL